MKTVSIKLKRSANNSAAWNNNNVGEIVKAIDYGHVYLVNFASNPNLKGLEAHWIDGNVYPCDCEVVLHSSLTNFDDEIIVSKRVADLSEVDLDSALKSVMVNYVGSMETKREFLQVLVDSGQYKFPLITE